ncbi:dolichyl-phosphate-mannose--protein mannosyltransferase [Nesterenkonia alkaliphila]|uniref:dolichyl-phosphate-mannose--protein mannosyltransferase n=1 Tax=Nesterenkonia alkaliphila TaxID=1463631 RepID=UPI0019A47064|nr:phospholipid carrier-dependent glycosyltransferase [Nesterenkonia alkaliphila]GFZ94751.1 dolichyl-phosphate-mannose--protein mannosyltransferase [Nesterenkonia alkaliphila]
MTDALTRSRLELRLGADRFRAGLWGWLVPLSIAAVALALRLDGLSNPHSLIFDETYYAKDAYALLQTGYELEWPEGADEHWEAGNPQPLDEGSFVVHPPLGKWLIGLGIAAYGVEDAIGWRLSSAVAGALGVLLIALIAQRMFRSVFLGAVAGVLTAVEGHHLVMSRVALLDIFLMLFVLAAFGALLADRYSGRRRLAAWAAQAAPESKEWDFGPLLLWRPWRLAAAVALGCAVGVKLSGLAFIAVFGIMVVLWDINARRTVGIRRWARAGLLYDGLPAVLTVLPVATLTYIATWSGWLLSSGARDRDNDQAEGLAGLLPAPLRALWNYHSSATSFHTGLDSEHEYASHPWTWLFMGRPVSMHYQGREQGEVYEHTGEVCQYPSCSSAVLDLANPLIWWTGVLGLLAVLLLWIGRRDWRYGAILSGFAAGFVVWLAFPDRTMFFFYTISYQPFLILTLVVLAALVLRIGTGEVTASGRQRSSRQIASAQQRNTVLVICFVLLAVAVSVFFWPVWTAEFISYDQWRLRMWLQSWI